MVLADRYNHLWRYGKPTKNAKETAVRRIICILKVHKAQIRYSSFPDLPAALPGVTCSYNRHPACSLYFKQPDKLQRIMLQLRRKYLNVLYAILVLKVRKCHIVTTSFSLVIATHGPSCHIQLAFC